LNNNSPVTTKVIRAGCDKYFLTIIRKKLRKITIFFHAHKNVFERLSMGWFYDKHFQDFMEISFVTLSFSYIMPQPLRAFKLSFETSGSAILSSRQCHFDQERIHPEYMNSVV